MRTYRYLHLDVFTDPPFEGNQLAVFPEPAGLTTEQMQTIAREMNFSESRYLSAGGAGDDVRMRIFTPGEELPMAGHPTIGSTFALAQEGVIEPRTGRFVFGLGVGPTPVSLEWKGNALDFAWMTQKNPTVWRRGRRTATRLRARSALAPRDLEAPAPVRWCPAACRSCSPRWSRAPRSTACRSIRRRMRRPAAPPASTSCRSSSSPRTAAGRPMTRPSTAACSHPDSASPRIRRRVAPAGRLDATVPARDGAPRAPVARRQSAGGEDEAAKPDSHLDRGDR